MLNWILLCSSSRSRFSNLLGIKNNIRAWNWEKLKTRFFIIIICHYYRYFFFTCPSPSSFIQLTTTTTSNYGSNIRGAVRRAGAVCTALFVVSKRTNTISINNHNCGIINKRYICTNQVSDSGAGSSGYNNYYKCKSRSSSSRTSVLIKNIGATFSPSYTSLSPSHRQLLALVQPIFFCKLLSQKYSTTATTTATNMSAKKRVCIVGSGNWGSAIAKIIGANTVKYPDLFEEIVKIYVYEELVNGRKLTEIINQDHENTKYLPGHKLPTNIVADPDVVSTASDADIIVFVLPHQFIKFTCAPLVGKMKAGAVGLSLIKGFDTAEGGGIALISHLITKQLNIPCNVLMGANLAHEIAEGKFSETTIGTHDKAQGAILHKLIQTEDFRVVVVDDVDTVELCGALKNIVGVGAGFIDGLELGDNTKAAVIRLGLMEMVRFAEMFYTTKLATFLESCGVADLITTCYGGRNRKIAEAFVRTGKKLEELEAELLNGQRLQGPHTAEEVNFMLKAKGVEHKFPLFTGVHRICIGELPPKALIDCIRNHPEHVVRGDHEET